MATAFWRFANSKIASTLTLNRVLPITTMKFGRATGNTFQSEFIHSTHNFARFSCNLPMTFHITNSCAAFANWICPCAVLQQCRSNCTIFCLFFASYLVCFNKIQNRFSDALFISSCSKTCQANGAKIICC